jgi:MFS superfamily sulfate permease-like transporter
MLAAIGIIIISKQSHILLGATPTSKNPLDLLLEIPHSVLTMNPAIAAIGATCAAVLVFWPLVPNAKLKRVPAPLLVVILSIGMSAYLGLNSAHHYSWSGTDYDLSEKFLVSVPSSFLSALTSPDFSQLLTRDGLFWVMMFCLIGSLESILSAKAVDLLDPAKRRTDFDRDLMAVGVANVVAGCLGGLPMISEIVRSRANIDNGAKDRFAHLFHGLFLLMFLALAPGLLHRIPLAALAAMLVYTGTRLASPREFLHMYKLGLDQLVVFVGTVIAVLATDLLIGILIGAGLEIGLHLLRGVSWKALWRPSLELEPQLDGHVIVRSQDSAVFTTWLRLRNCLTQCTPTERVVLDLSKAAIVDHTVLSKLEDLRRDWSDCGRLLDVTGLEHHKRSSAHPLSCRQLVEGSSATGSKS